jgi:hypothetical protein
LKADKKAIFTAASKVAPPWTTVRIIEMREKRSMRAHEKGLAALWAFLIGILTLRAVRILFSEWLEQRKSK